ncbi:MAG: hypothetical protein K2K79_06470 [Paramuribaculum sp.]|nr:hypothetical protein [Paramuribaculum sp.]
MSKSQYLVHRCPHCKSRAVIKIPPKKKSMGQQALEVLGGAAEAYYLGTDGSITEWISNNINDPSKQPKYRCTSCNGVWNNPNLVDETPLPVLEEEKKDAISRFKSAVWWDIIIFLIPLAITIWSFHYCWINDFTSKRMEDNWLMGTIEVTDYHWLWPLVGIIFIVSAIFTFKCFNSISEDYNAVKRLKSMSLESFRWSKLRN